MNHENSWCDASAQNDMEMDKAEQIIFIVAKWLQPEIEYKHLRRSVLYEPVKEKIMEIING